MAMRVIDVVGGPVPVLVVRGTPDHVARKDLHDRLAFALRPAAACGDIFRSEMPLFGGRRSAANTRAIFSFDGIPDGTSPAHCFRHLALAWASGRNSTPSGDTASS